MLRGATNLNDLAKSNVEWVQEGGWWVERAKRLDEENFMKAFRGRLVGYTYSPKNNSSKIILGKKNDSALKYTIQKDNALTLDAHGGPGEIDEFLIEDASKLIGIHLKKRTGKSYII